MKSISINLNDSDLTAFIADLLQKPIRIDVNGNALAILISSTLFYELVEAEEELEDLKAYDESIQENGLNIPWDEVNKDLGLA